MAYVNTNTDLQKSKRINGRFTNPWPTWKMPTFYNLIKFLYEKNNSSIPSKEEVVFTILLHRLLKVNLKSKNMFNLSFPK
jgi:hypothetical protein